MFKACHALAAAAILLVATGCNPDKPLPPQQQPDTVIAPEVVPLSDTAAEAVTEGPVRDPDRQFLDSMMGLELTLPPILDEKSYDTATINNFIRLAKLSGGEMRVLASADLLEKNISDIICKHTMDFSDVLFLMDATGSMSDDVAEIRQGMTHIIDVLRERRNVRLAIATYKDMQEDSVNWYSFRNFEGDFKAASSFVDSVQVGAGGDVPESVYEAFIATAGKKFWRSPTKRVVLIIGDATGKDKAHGGRYDLEDMVRVAGANRIKVNFFPLIVTPYSGKYRSGDGDPQPLTETPLIDNIYPNPVTTALNIRLLQPGRHKLSVYTMTGVMVDELYTEDAAWALDLGRHPDGLYVLRVLDAHSRFDQRKFVIKH